MAVAAGALSNASLLPSLHLFFIAFCIAVFSFLLRSKMKTKKLVLLTVELSRLIDCKEKVSCSSENCQDVPVKVCCARNKGFTREMVCTPVLLLMRTLDKMPQEVLADAADAAAIQIGADGNGSSSSSSEFFTLKAPKEDDDDGVIEDVNDEEKLAAEEYENIQMMNRRIQVYEREGERLALVAELSLSGVGDYCSFARKLHSCCPTFNVIHAQVPHVLWPWWPITTTASYVSVTRRQLDPSRVSWDEFHKSLNHVIVSGKQPQEVVYLHQYDGEQIIRTLHIPKGQIQGNKHLNFIIYMYVCALDGKENYGGEPPLDPWPCYVCRYTTRVNASLERPDYIGGDDYGWYEGDVVLPGEEQGEEQEVETVEDGEEDDKDEVDDEAEVEDEEDELWGDFMRALKHIDARPWVPEDFDGSE